MGVCNMIVKKIVTLKLFKIFTNLTLGEFEELTTLVVSTIACHMCDLENGAHSFFLTTFKVDSHDSAI